jgi:hypothetical protein
MRLLSDDQLERSGIVANCRMNRERDLAGSNGYDRELGFDPLDFLKERLTHVHTATWLDSCCGTGKALIQAARSVHAKGLARSVEDGLFEETLDLAVFKPAEDLDVHLRTIAGRLLDSNLLKVGIALP